MNTIQRVEDVYDAGFARGRINGVLLGFLLFPVIFTSVSLLIGVRWQPVLVHELMVEKIERPVPMPRPKPEQP